MIWQKKLSFLSLFCLFLFFNSFFSISVSAVPSYTYTGSSTLVDDGNGNYRIKFLTSGTFTPTNNMTIDAFLVGGGGASGGSNNGGGGGGGYTTTINDINLVSGNSYNIVIGSGGVGTISSGTGAQGLSSSAFGYSATGGYGGTTLGKGGNGGSGGGGAYNGNPPNDCDGGIDGGNGGNGGNTTTMAGGTGQGSTTYEFNGGGADLYAGGGASYNGYVAGGGGGYNTNGTPNTGGGAGSSYYNAIGKNGGSGIVIIRYLEASEFPNADKYLYTGSSTLADDGNGTYRIKFLTSGTFTPANNMMVDAFFVGGGGASGGSLGGGGGSGYTNTINDINLVSGNKYSVVVGGGGMGNGPAAAGAQGWSSSAFSYSATGGYGGTTLGKGGNGGSGGGGTYYSGGSPNDCGGGIDGGNGGNGGNTTTYAGGTGQGTTTYEFNSGGADLYAGGGASYNGYVAGGGGGYNTNGTPNTGGGAGSAVYNEIGKNGGSGIVIIRFLGDTTPPTVNSITTDQELATPSGESVTLTVSGLADTGGSGLASLKYSYFVPGSSSWTQVTVANANASASFDIPITKEGTYYVKAVAIDSASNLSNEVETSIFINRGTFTASPSPSPVPSFTKPLQIKDIAKGSYVSFNGYLFIKLAGIGETGPFLAVSPLCEQPLVLTSSGILDNTNTIYTGNLPTPGQTTVALVSSPDSSMHGTCTWSSTTNPSLSSIISYLDSNHCIANLNTSTTTSYTVSMTGCLTTPTTSLTVSLAEFAGE